MRCWILQCEALTSKFEVRFLDLKAMGINVLLLNKALGLYIYQHTHKKKKKKR